LAASGEYHSTAKPINHFDKKSHICQPHNWYSPSMKKIVAHIQRTVTISTISTRLDVSVSEEAANTLAVPPRDPTIMITNPEGEKDEKIKVIPVRSTSARRKPAGGVLSGRGADRKPGPGIGCSGSGNRRSSRSNGRTGRSE
jgi:hypothetical protein